MTANPFLAEMGIQQWQEQKTPAPLHAILTNRQTPWLIVSEINEEQKEKALNLLDKILAAAKLEKVHPLIETDFDSTQPLASQLIDSVPQLILLMGEQLTQTVLNKNAPIDKLRQQKHTLANLDYPVFATYSLKAILENEQIKRPVWQDIKYCTT